MISLREVFQNPVFMLAVGLALGLWAAAIVAIRAYAVGYQQGVKYCLGQIAPLEKAARNLADSARDR